MSVFANGLEVSGKATPNKTIAAMPDVCMSPPPPPAGPVPIPYPLFGMASDTTDGCTSVFVKGKEAGKKNASKYSKTTGDEPATNSFGAGVVSHKITGPLKFAAYSFDVIFEGGGAERFTDLTTQNHMNSDNKSAGMSAAQAAADMGEDDNPCAKLQAANDDVRNDMRSREEKRNEQKAEEDQTDHAEKPTITHGVLTSGPGGPRTVVRACSNRRMGAYYNGMAKGMKQYKRGSKQVRRKSNACGGHMYEENRSDMRPHTAHTEARIIEDLFANGAPPAGSTLLLGINWNTATPPEQSTDACEHCRKLLCAVGGSGPDACMTIKVCVEKDGEQKPVDVKELYC
jgi:Domain of unknown function (DUF4150)